MDEGARGESEGIRSGASGELVVRLPVEGEALDRGELPPREQDPAGALLAVAGTRVLGILRGSFPDAGTYAFGAALTRAGEDRDALVRALLTGAARAFAPRALVGMSWDRDDQREWHGALVANGFEVTFEKAYYRRALADPLPAWPEAPVYRTLRDVGEAPFLEVLSRVREGALDRALCEDSVEHEWRSYREGAGEAFDPGAWRLAYRGTHPLGVVLPQIYPDVRDEGSVFALGVVPDVRSRGLGRALHAEGLRVLAERGAARYVGSTDVGNAPMARVFAANGCERVGVRRFYRRPEIAG